MITPSGPQLSATIREIRWPLIVMVAFDVAVVVSFLWLGWKWVALPHIPLSILGVAMGVILSFRNTSTYQRWWEARTLWGSMVNYSRTLARQTVTMTLPAGRDAADEEHLGQVRRRIVYYQIAYVHALRRHLRDEEPWEDLTPFLDRREIASLFYEQNVPMEIQRRIGRLLAEAFERGWLDSIRWSSIDNSLTALANAQGGAERIKATPFPLQYDYLQQTFVRVYCLLLPLGMVANLGILTPVGSSLIGFFLMLLDKIGRDLEEPFGNTIHDVPLTSICRTIEVNLRQQLEEADLPASEPTVHGVLW
jgi:ion channel-forming bestrophin family protein